MTTLREDDIDEAVANLQRLKPTWDELNASLFRVVQLRDFMVAIEEKLGVKTE